MSVRGDICIAIKERLSALGGFTTVTRWRDTQAEPFTAEDCPALNFKDGDCTVTHYVSDDEHALSVVFDVIAVPGVLAEDVETLLNSVVEEINRDDTWAVIENGNMRSLADGTNIEGHDIDTSAETAETITAGQVKATINYTTPKGQI